MQDFGSLAPRSGRLSASRCSRRRTKH